MAEQRTESRKLPLLRPDDSAIEGGLAGALGGWVFGPIGGLVAGLATGILSRRMREYQIDALQAEQEIVRNLDGQMEGAVNSAFGQSRTPMDEAQLEHLTREYAAQRELTMSPDPNVRSAALAKLADWQPRIGEWMQDIEDRSHTLFDRDVSLLDQQATIAQADFKEGLRTAQDAAAVGEELHRLLNDPTFDVNMPLNRSRLGQLFESTPSRFFADPENFGQLLQDVGARAPLIGMIPQWLGGKMKIEDMEWTPEDWRKIAFAMQMSSKNYGEQVMADAAQMGQALDAAAGQVGHVPPVTYLDRIISGRVQEGGVSGQQGIYQRNQEDRTAEGRAAQREAALAARREQTANYGEQSQEAQSRAAALLRRILGRATDKDRELLSTPPSRPTNNR